MQNDSLNSLVEIDCYPIDLKSVEISDHIKLPVDKLASLGVAYQPAVALFQKFTGNVGGEGLYRVTFPPHAKNGSLVKFHNEDAFMGGIKLNGSNEFAGQARLNKIPCDPTMICVALVMLSINQKLDAIQETQKEILEFLQLKEKAIIRGNVLVLHEILEEYKFNIENEKYKTNKHIQVQEIKRDAEQSVVFCRGQIEKKAGKKSWLHNDRDVKLKLQKLLEEFKEYELALYIYALSSFLEIVLIDNYDSGYLNTVISRIEDYADAYHELHVHCYEEIAKESKSSIEAFALKGVSTVNKTLGTLIGRIPKIKDGQIDESLIQAGEKVTAASERRSENILHLFANEYCTCIQPFIENIMRINVIFNQPVELMFDQRNVYLKQL